MTYSRIETIEWLNEAVNELDIEQRKQISVDVAVALQHSGVMNDVKASHGYAIKESINDSHFDDTEIWIPESFDYDGIGNYLENIGYLGFSIKPYAMSSISDVMVIGCCYNKIQLKDKIDELEWMSDADFNTTYLSQNKCTI